MLSYQEGNFLNTSLPAIAHGVNLKGVMGLGIAKTIKRLFPDVFEAYRIACSDGTLQPGGVLAVETVHRGEPFWVFNVASQILPGRNAEMRLLEPGVVTTLEQVDTLDLSGVAFPKIGAGIGGLDERDVEEFIASASTHYPHRTVEYWTYKPGA